MTLIGYMPPAPDLPVAWFSIIPLANGKYSVKNLQSGNIDAEVESDQYSEMVNEENAIVIKSHEFELGFKWI